MRVVFIGGPLDKSYANIDEAPLRLDIERLEGGPGLRWCRELAEIRALVGRTLHKVQPLGSARTMTVYRRRIWMDSHFRPVVVYLVQGLAEQEAMDRWADWDMDFTDKLGGDDEERSGERRTDTDLGG